jgi:hypothetical protein
MKRPFCLVSYRIWGAPLLDTFSGKIVNGLYANPLTFASPPVSAAEFAAVFSALVTCYSNFKMYGKTEKFNYEVAHAALIEKLDELSTYVDEVAAGNASKITLSGFVPSSERPEKATEIDKIEVFTVKQTNGKITVETPAITNKGAVNYNCVCVAGSPLRNPVLVNGQIILSADDPQIHQDFNKSRIKTFPNLIIGVQYFFYVFAANSAGVSPLSDPKSLYFS